MRVAGEGGGARIPYYSRLAGQTAPYLYRQLRAFQTGERDYALMNRVVSDLPVDSAVRPGDQALPSATIQSSGSNGQPCSDPG